MYNIVMCTCAYITVLDISDYFLRQDSINEIIRPNNRNILRHFIQIPKLYSKKVYDIILQLVLY